MSHSASDFEKNKLQQWKNTPLVDDDYFDKLPLCVMQRIQMNDALKKDAIHFKPIVSDNKKNYRILYYLSGIAAVFVISFGLIYRHSSSTNQQALHESTNTNKNNGKNLAQDSASDYKNGTEMEMENRKMGKKQAIGVPEVSNIKSDPTVSDPFETALQTITDDELEELNWTLYLNETF